MEFLDIRTYSDFCRYFCYDTKKLGYQIYVIKREDFYDEFEIEKKSGENRIIHSPKGVIKKLQKLIKIEIEKIYKKTNICYGFVKGKSIVDNAKIHVNKKWVFNIDIKDFFPSITFQRIYGLFVSKPFDFNKDIAGLIANIATYEGKLPQGSPLSPILSNAICFRLDRAIGRYLRSSSIIVSRYADDITFSSNDYNHVNKVYVDNDISDNLRGIIEKNGFLINFDKTRMRYYCDHQEVTGIIVNQKLNIKKHFKYKLRSILHAWEKYGERKVFFEYMNRQNIEVEESIDDYKGLRRYVEGLLAYTSMVLGKSNSFYKKCVVRYNTLIKKNKILLPLSNLEAIENAIFVIESGGKQGTSFVDSKGHFYTCLHNIIDLETYKEFPITDVVIDNWIRRGNTKVFNKGYSHLLNDYDIIYYSKEEDLLVFSIKEFFLPYYFKIDNSKVDRRCNYSVIGYPDTENKNPEILDEKAKFLAERVNMGIKMNPINSKIVQGMSGAPIISSESNFACGLVVYGDEETEELGYAKNGANEVLSFYRSSYEQS